MQPNPRRNLEPLLDESALLRTAPRTFVLPEEWGPLESFMRAGAGDDAGPPTVIVKPKGRQQGQGCVAADSSYKLNSDAFVRRKRLVNNSAQLRYY
jgi:hypothetical protein